MVLYCCAFGCESRYEKGSPSTFHSFPKDEGRRKLWEIKVRRKNFTATSATKICSKHFEEECFDREKFGCTWLKNTAVPTIFNFPTHLRTTTKPRKPVKRLYIEECDDSKVTVKRHKEENATDIAVAPRTSVSTEAEGSSSMPHRYRYIGDFNEQDFQSPRKAKEFLTIVKNERMNHRSKCNKLRMRKRRLVKKVAVLNSIIDDLRNKSLVSESAANLLQKNYTGRSMEPIAKGKGTVAAEHCFVCNKQICEGVLLVTERTQYSHTDLPTKIGHVVGEEFLVVVNAGDVLCRQCESLLNLVDRLEVETFTAKEKLMTFLRNKYKLPGGRQATQTPRVTSADGCNGETEGEVDKSIHVEEDHVFLEMNRLNGIKLTEKYADVEDMSDTCKPLQSGKQDLTDHICASCGFKAQCPAELTLHATTCDAHNLYLCVMCNKHFRNKEIQRHITQQHLSVWICHFCDVQFAEEEEYTSHLGTHLTHSAGRARLRQAANTTTQSGDKVQTSVEGSFCNQQATKNQFLDSQTLTCEPKPCRSEFTNQTLVSSDMKPCSSLLQYKDLSSKELFANEHVLSYKTFENTVNVKDLINSEGLGKQDISDHRSRLLGKQIYAARDAKVIDQDNVQSPREQCSCKFCFEQFGSKSQCAEHLKTCKFLQPIGVGAVRSTKINQSEREVMENVQSAIKKAHLNSVLGSTRNKDQANSDNSPEVPVFKCICGEDFSDMSQFEEHEIHGRCAENIFKEKQVVGSSPVKKRLLVNDSVQFQENYLTQTLVNLSPENTLFDVVSHLDDEPSNENSDEVSYVLDMGRGSTFAVVDSEEESGGHDALERFNNHQSEVFEEIKQVQRKTLKYLCAVCGYCSPELSFFKKHFDKHKSQNPDSSIEKNNLPKQKVVPLVKSEKLRAKLIKLCHYERPPATKQTLPKNKLQELPLEQYFCTLCNKSFSSWVALRKHKINHSDKLPYRCENCFQYFSEETELIQHKEMKHTHTQTVAKTNKHAIIKLNVTH